MFFGNLECGKTFPPFFSETSLILSLYLPFSPCVSKYEPLCRIFFFSMLLGQNKSLFLVLQDGEK